MKRFKEELKRLSETEKEPTRKRYSIYVHKGVYELFSHLVESQNVPLSKALERFMSIALEEEHGQSIDEILLSYNAGLIKGLTTETQRKAIKKSPKGRRKKA